MTCQCCHCCFCCCEQNYDNNPNDPKRRKVDNEPPLPKPDPITRSTPVHPPIEQIDEQKQPVIEHVTRSVPLDWPPLEPTIEDYITPIQEDYEREYEDFSFPSKPPQITPVEPLIQLTPTFSVLTYSGSERMDRSTTLSQSVESVTNQGPDPGWIGTTWDNGWGEWDGTPIVIDGLTPSQICPLLFKNGYTMKGLRQLYYSIMPFADETRPTIAEIDAWNIEIIRHLRRLVGNNTPLEGDRRLYLEAHWADERRFTRYWDQRYPGTNCSAYGPCALPCSNQHCGATFVPNFEDQAPYLVQYPGLEPFNFITGGAEGIGAVNTNVPWALKLVQRLSNWVCTEGTGGHAGPCFNREKVGMSFFTALGATSTASGTTLRMKWL